MTPVVSEGTAVNSGMLLAKLPRAEPGVLVSPEGFAVLVELMVAVGVDFSVGVGTSARMKTPRRSRVLKIIRPVLSERDIELVLILPQKTTLLRWLDANRRMRVGCL